MNNHLWRFLGGIACLLAAIYASGNADAIARLFAISRDLAGDIRSFLLGTGATLIFLSGLNAAKRLLAYLGDLTHVYPAWRSSIAGCFNEFHDDAAKIDYGEQLKSSKSCTIVLNDGFNWTKRNWRHLVDRVNVGLPTTFVVCHPDSAWLGYISEKSNKSPAEQRNDILQCAAAVRLLASINENAAVEIVGSRLINCYAAFLFEAKIYVSPYHTRFRQDLLPALELRKAQRDTTSSAFRMFESDIVEHIRNCRAAANFDLLSYPEARELPKIDLKVPGVC